ncbi:MAG TPA: class I SAM-dependent methyltransferase [Bacillota bacterium]
MVYDRLANVYDQWMSDTPYDEWTRLTEELFKSFPHPLRTVIDLGCGTGEVTTRLAEKGYEMIGVDYSENMLTQAQHKASEKQLNIQWIRQDLRKLEGFCNLDAAISYCDVMNYITSEQDVQTVFQRVAHALKDGGLFIFDVHSLDYVQHQLIHRTFADVTEEEAYIWFCYEGDYEGEMYHDLTFFKRSGELYHRFDEYHHQRTFPIDVYKKLLRQAGFEIQHVFADFSLQRHPLEGSPQRIFFVANKNEGMK